MRAKKKQLTLDEAWDLCLEQWDWIKAQKKAGSKLSTKKLKDQWCEENGHGDVEKNCFFCEYNSLFDCSSCDNCPGRLVDSKFYCDNEEYSYINRHFKFHAKLVELNKIRLGLKKNSEEPYAC